MRTSEADIFILPGYTNSGEDHWQTRWERKLATAQRVVQDDWHAPKREDWTKRIVHQVSQAQRPAILVAHSLGVLAALHAAHDIPKGLVKGAFLVAPPDLHLEGAPESIDKDFAHSFSERPFPFPSVLVASQNDPYCSFEQAQKLAEKWGSTLADAGHVGHINTESGHGPWPEGLMRFAGFLQGL
ncbi:alpha/beta hydrolase [Microvirga sp. W0021]|uniref:Alpha/beta hydrolase n=1 Tax=Hohaiivirga grylli TaxID=3133970 RepID=A0ABV0BLA3_9HYPH